MVLSMSGPWVETEDGERKGSDYIGKLDVPLIDRAEVGPFHSSGLDDSVDGGLIHQAI